MAIEFVCSTWVYFNPKRKWRGYRHAYEIIMRIDKLLLKNFRNHTLYEADLHKNINVFIGENGQGKTSILEACSLALTGKSFRNKGWVQEGKDEASIYMQVTHANGQGEVACSFSRNQATKVFYNSKLKRGSYPFRKICVFFTPEDLVAIRGEASFRRKLMDDLVQNTSPEVVDEFYKILAQKNRFLKLCKQGNYSSSDQKSYWQTIQEKFLEKSLALLQARFQALETILPYWKKRGCSFLDTKDFDLIYLGGKDKEVFSVEEAFQCLKKDLKEREVLERIQGYSLAGPQRHDLRFLCQKKEARSLLSQGQQKALLLSWKMAQWDRLFHENEAKKEESPALFFDDVFSEIDQHFSKNLVEFLLENQAQSFVATLNWETHLSSQEGLLFHLGTRIKRKAKNDKRKPSNDQIL